MSYFASNQIFEDFLGFRKLNDSYLVRRVMQIMQITILLETINISSEMHAHLRYRLFLIQSLYKLFLKYPTELFYGVSSEETAGKTKLIFHD